MTRKVTLLVLALLAVHLSSFAQRSCGFSLRHQKLMATNPAYASAVADFETRWQNHVNTTPPATSALKLDLPTGDTVYEIPVVVHVIHTGGSIGTQYNPTDAQINAYLDYTNQAWAASYASYPNPASGGTRIPIRFVLAKRDTNCFAATGIVRYNGGAVLPNYTASGVNFTGSGGETELSVKNLSRWNPYMYYNIWIVNKIDGSDIGASVPAFSTMATGSTPELDGTIILASQVTAGPGNTTLIHELGHAFNLYDVYEGDNGGVSCPSNTNCNVDGDRVCDTEPVKRSNGVCPSGTNPCTGSSYLNTPQNFMDNSSCPDRFTPGQRKRIMYALKSQLARSGYITSLGATAPPTAALPTSCFTYSSNPANTFGVGVFRVYVADPSSVATAARDTFMGVVSSSYNGDGYKAYIDNTCRHRVTLIAGRKYSLVVTNALNPGPGVQPTKVKAFIDYNNDGIFASSEQILNTTNGFSQYAKQADFTPPTSAVMCTPLRMRIIADGASSSANTCGALDYGQAEDYTVYLRGAGTPIVGSVTINNPPIGGNPSCFGTQLKFYAIPSSNITVTGYKWYRNGVQIPGATTDTLTISTLLNNDTIKARVFYPTFCGIDSATSNQDTIRRAVTVAPTVTVGLTAGAIPGCIDDTLTFSVVGTVNPGGSPTFVWQRDIGSGYVTIPAANAVISSNGRVLKTFNNPSGANIRVQMTSSAGAPCAIPATVTSNSFQVSYTTKPPTVSIALTTGTNPGCAGLPVTITATPVAGGATPVYAWYVNGALQTGATTNTFTKVFNNGDQIYAVLTSNSPCASTPNATSNTITIIQQQMTADVSINITSTPPLCDGHSLQFAANTTNGGTNPTPTYQWRVNGVDIGSPQGPTASLVILDHDVVSAVMIATDPCVANPRDTSNDLEITTKASLIPKLSVDISQGKNPGCLDSLVEFTANLSDLGTGPVFTWYVNGFPAATGSVFSSNSLLDGDIVRVRAHQTDGQCYLPDTIYAKPDTMVRSLTLDPPVIHLVGNMIMTDRQGTFAWFGPAGLVKGETKVQYYPSAVGPYYAVSDNRGCWSRPSNVLMITLLDINTVDLTDVVKIYPNPTSGQLHLDWKGKNVNVEIAIYNSVGQKLITENVDNAAHKSINLNGLADGNYYVVITDENNKTGTLKIALKK